MMVQRQTIVHNVSDEPITVQQSDGSHITVPARGQRPAKLPSEMDFLTQSTPQDQPPPWLAASSSGAGHWPLLTPTGPF